MVSANNIENQARAGFGKNEVDGSIKEIIDVYNSHKPPEPPTSKQSKLPIWAYCRLF